MTSKYQTQINDKREFHYTKADYRKCKPYSSFEAFWKQSVNIRASACGLLEWVQRISIRKIFCIILSRSIFLIYLVEIFEVPSSFNKILHGMSDIYFGHEKQFCFFLLFWHSCQAFAWDSAQGTIVIQWPSAQGWEPSKLILWSGYIWAIPKFPAVQAGGHAQQYQGSALRANNVFSSPVHKFPHCQHDPNPHCKHNISALKDQWFGLKEWIKALK